MVRLFKHCVHASLRLGLIDCALSLVSGPLWRAQIGTDSCPYGGSVEDPRRETEYDLNCAKHYTRAPSLLILLQTLPVACCPGRTR